MPAPPPNGASSTVRCTSDVCSRRSWVRRSSRLVGARPAEKALRAERVDQRREDGEHVDLHGVQAYEAMIFHITDTATWDASQQQGYHTGSTRGVDLAEEGYIHCSTAEQWQGVIERYYSGASDLVLLAHRRAVPDLARGLRAAARSTRTVSSRLRSDQPCRGRDSRAADQRRHLTKRPAPDRGMIESWPFVPANGTTHSSDE